MKTLISGELKNIEAAVFVAIEAMRGARSISELQEATAGLFAAAEMAGDLKRRTEELAVNLALRTQAPEETEADRERRMREWGEAYARCQLENCVQWGKFPFTPLRPTLFEPVADGRDLEKVIEGYEGFVAGVCQFAGDIQRLTLKDLRERLEP